MPHQFISPNWHVLFLHYPIAFLSFGIIIELFSFFWPRGNFRAAGRWMLLLGGLLSIPTLVVGLYAFREAVISASGHPHAQYWYQVRQMSLWSGQQWHYMTMHVWLNSVGVAIAAASVVFWIAATDMLRRKVHVLVAAGFLVAMGLFSVGAWYGGEGVYRYGTAVNMPSPQTPQAQALEMRESATHSDPGHAHDRSMEDSVTGKRQIKFYVPPLELHLTLAGFAIALSLAALGLTIRRLEKPVVTPTMTAATVTPTTATPITSAMRPVRPPSPSDATAGGISGAVPRNPANIVYSEPPPDPVESDPLRDRTVVEQVSDGPDTAHLVVVTRPPVIFPGRYWMLAFVVLLLTAAAGLWSVVGTFNRDSFSHAFEEIRHRDHLRLLLHSLFGISYVVLAIILAGLAKFGRKKQTATSVFLAVAVLVIAVQIWLGILLLFDGHEGPLFRFEPAGNPATQPYVST